MCIRDRDNNDNPLECGLDKYVNLDTQVNFLGKEKLKEIKQAGITRKLMGVIIDAKEINVSKSIELINEKNQKIGDLRSGTYSPHFKKVIGIAMLNKPYFKVSQTFKICLRKFKIRLIQHCNSYYLFKIWRVNT